MVHGISSSSLNGNDMRVLVALLEKGTSNLSGLSDAVGNQSTRKNTVEKLADMGLAEYELTNSTHLSYRVTLTELGMQIAVLLTLSEECLTGNLDIGTDSLDERARSLLEAARSKKRIEEGKHRGDHG